MTKPGVYLGLTAPTMKDGSETRDGNACAIRVHENGTVSRLVGIQEERLTGRRYDNGVTASIAYCLGALDYTNADTLYVAFSNCMEEPWTPAEVSALLLNSGLMADEITIVDHHISHAFEAFVGSGFRSALVLVIDGRGNAVTADGIDGFESQSYYRFESTPEGQIVFTRLGTECLTRPGYGELFRSGTRCIGFPGYHHASKLMAIAGIAKARGIRFENLNTYVDDRLELAIPIEQEDVYTPIVNWFAEQGIAYTPRSEAWYSAVNYESNGASSIREYDYFLARSIQESYEAFLLHRVQSLCRETGETNVCIGGGNALNCVANGSLLQHTSLKVHVGYAPSDAGQSLGNLAYALNRQGMLSSIDCSVFATPYIGMPCTDEQVEEALGNYAQLAVEQLSASEMVQRIADDIIQGKIVGLSVGGAEFGPRALGHRSILGRADSADVIERLRAIKHREDYQPFALSALEGTFPGLISPFMSFAPIIDCDAHPSIRRVVHADHTCRIQTIAHSSDSLLGKVLALLKEQGIEGIINTSFNGRGKPIAETPEDALRLFCAGGGMDSLALGSYYITGGCR